MEYGEDGLSFVHSTKMPDSADAALPDSADETLPETEDEALPDSADAASSDDTLDMENKSEL